MPEVSMHGKVMNAVRQRLRRFFRTTEARTRFAVDYYVTATTSIKSDPWARVIAFDRTACAEGIEHGVTGWIAPNGDFAAYADGLTHDFSEWKSGALGSSLATVASWAARNFQSCVLAGKICNVYAQVGGLDNMNLKVHNTRS